MLALKKKREEEKKKAEEAAKAAAAEGSTAAPDDGNKVSLLGVGGKKKKSENGTGTTGKKRTPGEIRIQKGKTGRKEVELSLAVCWSLAWGKQSHIISLDKLCRYCRVGRRKGGHNRVSKSQ